MKESKTKENAGNVGIIILSGFLVFIVLDLIWFKQGGILSIVWFSVVAPLLFLDLRRRYGNAKKKLFMVAFLVIVIGIAVVFMFDNSASTPLNVNNIGQVPPHWQGGVK